MSIAVQNPQRLFSTLGFFLLLLRCISQHVAESHEEGFKLPPMRNFMEDLNRARQLVNDGEYHAALDLLSDMSVVCDAIFGPEHPLTVEILIFKETAYFNAEKYDEALPLAWKIYKLQEKIHGEQDEKTGNALFRLGHIYFSMEKYGKAEGALKRAYRVRKSQLCQNHDKTIRVLFLLANVYQKSGDPEKLDLALRYYRKVYEVWSQHPQKEENHNDIRQTILKIGSILEMQNKLDEATQVLKNMVAMETKTHGEDSCWKQQEQEGKNILFRTLSKAGKAGEAKNVLGKGDQDIDQDKNAIYALVEGKVRALKKQGKYDKALELLTEFYQQEMSKPKVPPQIFRILWQLIQTSRFHSDVDTALKWANALIDLSKNQNQKVDFKGTVTTEEDNLNMVRLHLDALESCVYAYTQKKDEQNVHHYLQKIPEVIRGQALSDVLVPPLISMVKEEVNFRIEHRKKDEAIKILWEFMDKIDRPRWGSISLFCLSLMIEISGNSEDYREIDNMVQKFLTSPRNPQDSLKVTKGVIHLLLDKGNQLFEQGFYKTAFGLYKVLDMTWPTYWTDDDEKAPVFLHRVIKSASMLKKSDQVLFYMRKNAQALTSKLTTAPEMDLDQRAKITQEIDKLQAFQEQIKIAAEIPKDVQEFLNSRDFFWPKSTSKSQSKSNQDTREKTEL